MGDVEQGLELEAMVVLKRLLEREEYGYKVGLGREYALRQARAAFDLQDDAGYGVAYHAINKRIKEVQNDPAR